MSHSLDLPEGWRTKRLCDVAETQLGKTINPREKNGPRQRPYLRNANVQWDRIEVEDVMTMHFSEDEEERFKLLPGDLLICEGGIVGRAAIWSGPVPGMLYQNALHRVRPKSDEVTAAWILENFRYMAASGELAERARGNTILHLSQSELRQLSVVVPPRQCQDDLVATLGEVRSLTSSASAHLTLSRRAVDRFRQSVLVESSSGRMTASWRDQSDKSNHSIHAELNKIEAHHTRLRRGVDPNATALDLAFELPQGWGAFTVSALLASGALIDVKDGNHGSNHPKVSELTEQGLPFITANCVQDDGINYDGAPKVSGAALDRIRVGFSEPGDVVLTHKGSVGRVAVATAHAVLTPQTTYYRCNSAVLEPAYLATFMRSLYFYTQLAQVMSQTTRDFIPISDQYLLTVAVPPYTSRRK